MNKIQINKVSNANVYIDGNSFLGRAEEFQLPQVKVKMVDHKALGMVAAIRVPAGLEPMEAKIKWASLYPEAFDKYADFTKTCRLQLRASLESFDPQGRTSEVPVVVFLTAMFHEFPIGNFKHLDPAEFETSLTVYYLKLVVGGEEKLEIDTFANIYKVNGEDKLETYKANIGG
ncbi:MAG: phage major tail tube protein [Thermodesulfovibrionales bacterium]